MEVENLLSVPGSTAGLEEVSKPFKRKKCSYRDSCEPFRDNKANPKEYGQQYSHIYFTRLMMMSKLVEKKAKEKWGEADVCIAEYSTVGLLLDHVL